ncbi:hypothetical protein [Mesorhizobium mediterraneum]|jgi:hypothetical protein|uniref:hypothetical protein n=1 Tax=Mesorhizobium mediterraneum TaxID=43617 RepID=UPI00177EB802|nr:hypothetical protein [Mesorhizobium mediterraneum]
MPDSAEARQARIGREGGNQVSYTLKYSMVMDGHIKSSARRVGPAPGRLLVLRLPAGGAAHQGRYEAIVAAIAEQMIEDVDKVHIDCAGGAGPVDFNK